MKIRRNYENRKISALYKHFYYDIDAWELYDLIKDPNEIKNVYANPAYTDVVTDLKTEIKRLQNLYGDSNDLAQQFLQQDLERRKKK